MIALTFDDGPSRWTEPILDLLAEGDAKATFFVCGWAINGNEDILRRTVREGHEIGNHTYSHERLPGMNDVKMRAELRRTSEMIENVTERRPWLWRAPHFDYGEREERYALSLGMEHVDAHIDPSDWNSTADEIVSRVLLATGDGEIIDLHDGVPQNGGTGSVTREETVEAVRRLLGLVTTPFVTVSDLQVVLA